MLLTAGIIFWEICCNIPSCQSQKFETNHLYFVWMTHISLIHIQHVSCPHASPPKPYKHLSSPPYMPCSPPISSSITDHWNNTSQGAKIVKLPITQFSPVFCQFHFHTPSIFLGTLSLHSFLNMTDQVSHPHKIPHKIMVLYIYTLKIANGKTYRFWTECQEGTEIVKFSEFLHTSTKAQNITLLIFSLPRIFSSTNCRKYVKLFIPSNLNRAHNNMLLLACQLIT